MKIKELHIADFGKFHDYTLTFDSGLNCLYGQNEDGKTTLMTFLKMMFYGSTAHTGDLTKNPRKKYAPWSGAPMAGSVNFTHEGVSYRLERTFSASNATDRLVLFDLTHGEQENSTEAEIGKRFFGLSAGAFEKAYFVGQFGAPGVNTEADGELNTRLSGLVETGEEGVSFELLHNRLKEARENLLAPKHSKGRLDKAKKEVELLKEQLVLSRKAESEKQSLTIKVANEKDRLASAQKESDRLENQLAQAENWRNLKKLGDFAQSREKADALEQKLKKADGSAVEAEELQQAERLLTAARSAEEQARELTAERERLIAQIHSSPVCDTADTTDAAEQAVTQAQSAATQADTAFNEVKTALTTATARALGCLIPAVICLCFAVGIATAPFYLTALGWYSTLSSVLYYGIGGGLGLVSLVLFGVSLRFSRQKGVLRQRMEDTNRALWNAQAVVADKQSELAAAQAVLELSQQTQKQAAERRQADQERLDTVEQALEIGREKIRAAKTYCAATLKGATEETSLANLEIVLASYKESLKKYDEVMTRLNLLKVDLGQDMTVARAKALQQEIAHEDNAYGDPAAIREMLAFKRKEIAETQRDLAIDEANLKTAFLMHRHPTELEHAIAACEEQIAAMQAYYEALELADAHLTTAFGQVREGFGQALDEKAGAIFNRLTGGVWKGLTVSRNFEVSANHGTLFGSKGWQSLSAGTTDQAYLAVRLAIAELLSGENEGAPLFLDDALLQYDETREETALQYLQEYAAHRQVLLFSCRRLPVRYTMQSLRKEKKN